MIFDPVILLLFSIDTFFLKAFDSTSYAVSVSFRGTSKLATDRKLSAEKILNYSILYHNSLTPSCNFGLYLQFVQKKYHQGRKSSLDEQSDSSEIEGEFGFTIG